MRDPEEPINWMFWLAITFMAGGALILLAGCFGPPRLSAADVIPSGGDGSAGTIVERIAYWGTALGAFACVAAIAVAIWIDRRAGGRLAITGLGTIAACQALLWVGAYLAWITAIAVLVVLAVVGYRHRRVVESVLDRDLDGDGIVGTHGKEEKEA